MGNVALGPFLAAAGLLVLAGLPKLRDPLPLARALRSVGLPGGRGVVRLAAASEIAIGTTALIGPGRITGALVAASYLAFSAFVALAASRGGTLASCGCFGRPDTPPTRSHLVVTALLSASGIAVAVVPSSPWTVAPAQPAQVAALLALALLLGALAYLVIAVLPTVTPAAVRSASGHRGG